MCEAARNSIHTLTLLLYFGYRTKRYYILGFDRKTKEEWLYKLKGNKPT